MMKTLIFVKRIISVQFSSVAQSCPTLCDPMNRSTPGLPVHHQLPEFNPNMCIESVIPSSHLILCHPLLLLPPIPPSIRVFLTSTRSDLSYFRLFSCTQPIGGYSESILVIAILKTIANATEIGCIGTK